MSHSRLNGRQPFIAYNVTRVTGFNEGEGSAEDRRPPHSQPVVVTEPRPSRSFLLEDRKESPMVQHNPETEQP